jgi:transcriptional regulator GlxA family with amidase domain
MVVSLTPSADPANNLAMDRRVVIVIYDGFQLLDMAGPADVFTTASLFAQPYGYRVELTAVRAGGVRAHGGVPTSVETPIGEILGPIDTLLVVGGFGTAEHLGGDDELVGQIARLAAQARRTASVCTGSFLLAEAGLLDGRRATTHWVKAGEMRARYPSVVVDDDSIYVRDGAVWTSAGVTAGMDLALALVAEDHGHDLARDTACGLVVYLQRPGGQSQFSTPMRVLTPRRDSFRELQAWIDGHPADDLSVPALARRLNMSERHFSRMFTGQIGMSPGRYVELSRAGAAQRLLETTDDPLDRVARDTGLGAPETLYRVFRRHLRISPGDYRRRFRAKEH